MTTEQPADDQARASFMANALGRNGLVKMARFTARDLKQLQEAYAALPQDERLLVAAEVAWTEPTALRALEPNMQGIIAATVSAEAELGGLPLGLAMAIKQSSLTIGAKVMDLKLRLANEGRLVLPEPLDKVA